MRRVMVRVIAVAMVFVAGSPATPAGADTKVLLSSAIQLDETAGTLTLPLFMGIHEGDVVWYVVTESSDREDAEARGVNWAPKLANALATAAVQEVRAERDVVRFQGTIDFGPTRIVMPGPTGFPPDRAEPGAVGDEDYSPLITTGDGIVLNAPQVANRSGLHDRVVRIDFEAAQVTLALTAGLYHGKGILYISFDASAEEAAALEEATHAPNLDFAPGLASNDPELSARAAIVPIVNGPTGPDNPARQGLQSALTGEGPPLNVTEIHPRNRGKIPLYSPLWDVHPAVWTDEAIAAGRRRRLDHHEEVARLVEEGLLASGGAGPMNPGIGGLRAADFLVNCPIMALLD